MIEASCQRLPLLTPEKQARYLNHKIEQEDAGQDRSSVISRYMDLLVKVTDAAGAAGGVAHNLTVVVPERPVRA